MAPQIAENAKLARLDTNDANPTDTIMISGWPSWWPISVAHTKAIPTRKMPVPESRNRNGRSDLRRWSVRRCRAVHSAVCHAGGDNWPRSFILFLRCDTRTAGPGISRREKQQSGRQCCEPSHSVIGVCIDPTRVIGVCIDPARVIGVCIDPARVIGVCVDPIWRRGSNYLDQEARPC